MKRSHYSNSGPRDMIYWMNQPAGTLSNRQLEESERYKANLMHRRNLVREKVTNMVNIRNTNKLAAYLNHLYGGMYTLPKNSRLKAVQNNNYFKYFKAGEEHPFLSLHQNSRAPRVKNGYVHKLTLTQPLGKRSKSSPARRPTGRSVRKSAKSARSSKP